MPIKYLQIPKKAIYIALPDTSQETDTTCGASSLQAVCLYFSCVGYAKEPDVVKAMGMNCEYGANPEDIVRGAKKYGLRFEEEQPMSNDRLRELLREKKPVIMMIQAWGKTKSYRDDWDNGHWVVAIGYDEQHVYFEDPSIAMARGFLSWDELEDRWHDIGKYRKHVYRYGVAVWKECEKLKKKHILRARRIA